MKIIYEDENVLVIDKPAGIVVDEIKISSPPFARLRRTRVSDDFEKRVHRLDKDTSGILLIAKNAQSLEFLQKQFQERKVEKKYIALAVGQLKNNEGIIETLLGRSQKDGKKQKVYLPFEPGAEGKRKSSTKYKVLQKFKDYTLIEVELKTGRKHQIRAHFSYLGHPLAGDKMYGFKNHSSPKELKRQFLHANYLKIELPNKKIKEFESELPDDLKLCLQKLKHSSTPN